MAHLTQPVPSLAKVRPGLAAAAAFQPVVEKSMAKKPAARFKDADAMLSGAGGRHRQAARRGPEGRARRRKPTPRPLRAWRAPARVSGTRPHGGRGRRWASGRRRCTCGCGTTARSRSRPPRCPRRRAPSRKSRRRPRCLRRCRPGPRRRPSRRRRQRCRRRRRRRRNRPRRRPRRRKRPRRTKGRRTSRSRWTRRSRRSRRSSGTPPASPESRARNPWKEPVPRALRPIRDRINRGVHMSQKALHPAVRLRARRIPATRAPGFCSDAPTRRSIGSATPWNGTSGPTTSIRPVGATRRCWRIC